MGAKVEANIADFLYYVAERLEPCEAGAANLYELAEKLSWLDWTTPLYDDTQPTYNLSFKAAKTTDSPAGVFTINHKATGDYIDALAEDILSSYDHYYYAFNNGTSSDSITASYGTIDKSTLTTTNSIVTKFNKDDEVTSYKYAKTYNQSSTSSNDSLDDKSDDYVRTTSYKYSDDYTAATGGYNTSITYSDIYKSKSVNYTRSYSDKDSGIDDVNNTHSTTSKISYSNNDTDSGTLSTANIAYNYSSKYLYDNDSTFSSDSLSFTSVALKIVTSSDTASVNF